MLYLYLSVNAIFVKILRKGPLSVGRRGRPFNLLKLFITYWQFCGKSVCFSENIFWSWIAKWNSTFRQLTLKGICKEIFRQFTWTVRWLLVFQFNYLGFIIGLSNRKIGKNSYRSYQFTTKVVYFQCWRTNLPFQYPT